MSGHAAYSVAASAYHWAVGLPLMGCIGYVLAAQNAPKEKKGDLMFIHKSLGTLTGIIVAPRLAYRVFSSASYHVKKVQGAGPMEHSLSQMMHYALYGFMTVMPATGIAMGYYGGKGLPFFTTTIAGAKETNGTIAKNAFNVHKQVGTYGKYLVPLHIGGAVQHSLRGHTIFARMNPFRGPPLH